MPYDVCSTTVNREKRKRCCFYELCILLFHERFRCAHAEITRKGNTFRCNRRLLTVSRVSCSECGSFFSFNASSTMIGIWQLVLTFNVALANSGVDLTRVSAHGRTNGADAWPIRCRNGCKPSSTCIECTRGRVNPYRRFCDIS